jgi:hypothetical protein
MKCHIIIIITGKTALLEPQPFLENSASFVLNQTNQF